MARQKRGDAHYVNNKEFAEGLIACKKTGELSPFVIECFTRIAKRAIGRLHFEDPRDKEDCIQSALIDCVSYWKSFDPKRSMNAFAYFTQAAKNGYAKEWKKIHKKTGLDKDETLKFVSLSNTGEGSVYSI